MPPLSMAARAGLVGHRADKDLSPGPLRTTDLHGGRGQALVRDQDMCSFIHSINSHGISDMRNRVLDAKIWLVNHVEEKHKFFTKNTGCVNGVLCCLSKHSRISAVFSGVKQPAPQHPPRRTRSPSLHPERPGAAAAQTLSPPLPAAPSPLPLPNFRQGHC